VRPNSAKAAAKSLLRRGFSGCAVTVFIIHMRPIVDANPPSSLTLLEAVRRAIRARNLSIRTEQQYVYWVRCFVRHFQRRHPRDLGAPEVEAFAGNAGQRTTRVRLHS